MPFLFYEWIKSYKIIFFCVLLCLFYIPTICPYTETKWERKCCTSSFPTALVKIGCCCQRTHVVLYYVVSILEAQSQNPNFWSKSDSFLVFNTDANGMRILEEVNCKWLKVLLNSVWFLTEKCQADIEHTSYFILRWSIWDAYDFLSLVKHRPIISFENFPISYYMVLKMMTLQKSTSIHH